MGTMTKIGVKVSMLACGALVTCAPSWAQEPQSASQVPVLTVKIDGETLTDSIQTDEIEAVAQADRGSPIPAPIALTIPRLTEVLIAIDAELSSETSTRGDRFPIRLLEPVQIDGVEVLPAGTIGVGEVVHAKKKGGSGAGGEMILTALWLESGGRQYRMRSLRMGSEVQDRFGDVNTLAIVSAATIPLLAIAGFFITGEELKVMEGTPALARFADQETVEITAVSVSTDGSGGAIVGEELDQQNPTELADEEIYVERLIEKGPL